MTKHRDEKHPRTYLHTLYIQKHTGGNAETWHELAEDRTAWRKALKKGVRSFEDDRVKAREDKRLKRKANETLETISNKFLVPTLYVRHVAEPVNQG